MSSIIVKDEGTKRTLPPEGTHVARCYGMLQIGTVLQKGSFGEKKKNLILVMWELCNEMHEFKEGEGLKPFAVSKRYTLSFYQSHLRKDLESWRGKQYSDEDVKNGVDVVKLVGHPCMITVAHSEDGKYANVMAVTGMPKGITAPPLFNKETVLTYNDFDWKLYESFSDKMKELIASSDEFKALTARESQEAAADPTDTGTETNDDLPF